MGCNCGAHRAGVTSTWKVVDSSGTTLPGGSNFTSEADARMFASQHPGSRVRRV